MKGTQMLKEILKIDSSDTAETKPVINETSTCKQDSYGPASQHRHTKKMAAFMNKSPISGGPQNTQAMEAGGHPLFGPPGSLSTPVSELSRICSLVGMLQPEFSFLRTVQTMTVCQVKLSNGLLIHGPQCHSEKEAKEKAALFALQQLSSIGMNFPLPPPPVFPNYQQMGALVPPGSIPPVFTQHAANMFPSPPHAFGPVPWAAPVPVHGKAYYPGSCPSNMPLAGTVPVGTHNQFIPLQVTKKRAASKMHFDSKDFSGTVQDVQLKNEHPVSSDTTKLNPQDASSDPLRCPQAAQPIVFQEKMASASPSASHKKSTPNVSIKRKPRKLAVNFGVSKSSG
ncbi:5'-3' exoribonuclease 1-like [Sphaerodactylus townsendi]|uniref:5'-3' exoribonuclease 1-like n=1 Tax=Sphaerodactylus townsendi TaxID=933632 RepID=UPI0020262F7A|nr:5'-3' exoribonuclease 1-like [Sphaerodactylus townsendi]